jgi:hypothetical protein
MIDLRSDTLTKPDKVMLDTILTAPLGAEEKLPRYFFFELVK